MWFSGCLNSANIQHGYQRLAVEQAHATDVIGYRICHGSFCDALPLPNGDFHREAEDTHNRWFQVLCQERVQYNDNRTKKA